MTSKNTAIVRASIYVVVALIGLASALGLVSQEVSDWMSGNAETFIGLISSVAAMGGGILAVSNLHRRPEADLGAIAQAEQARTTTPATTGSTTLDLDAILAAEKGRS